jgi:hypothetical protein
MIIPLPALAIGAHLAFTIADTVPRLNIEPSCRTSAVSSPGITQDFDACLKDEQSARDQLASEWSTFAPADRTICIDLSQTGSSPTYTEMLTCMEMMRDARRTPADSVGIPNATGQPSTTGQRTR